MLVIAWAPAELGGRHVQGRLLGAAGGRGALILEVARASQVEPGYSSERGRRSGLRRRRGLAACGGSAGRKFSVAFIEAFLCIGRCAEHLPCVAG